AARPKCLWSARATRYLRSRRFIAVSGLRVARAAGAAPAASGAYFLHGGRGRGRGADQVVEGGQRGLGAFAHRDHDLLVRDGGAVAGGEHARDAGLAALVDHDLAARAQLHRALEPLGVGQQADLHEDALQFDAVAIATDAVLVDQAG